MTPDPRDWLAAIAPAWLLILGRTAGLAWTAPGWGLSGVGWRTKLGLAVLLAVVLGPSLGPRIGRERGLPDAVAAPGGASSAGVGWGAFGLALAVEAAIGAGLGLSAGLVVSAARQAGEVVGLQAGLSPAGLLTPEAGDPGGGGLTPLGHLFGLVALGIFLAADGPLKLVEVVAESYDALPVGLGAGRGFAVSPPTPELAARAFGHVGWALALAVRAAAPTALALVLSGLALGWLARASPALGPTLSGLAWPARSVLGLAFAWLGLAGLGAVVASAWTSGG